jgi:pimeloyl-ACP methyl ester carboxylesterase
MSIFMASLLWAGGAAPQTAPGTTGIAWVPHALQLGDGRVIEAERGTLTVPEDRGRTGGRTIDLALLRLGSRAQAPGAPIVYLEGGPGGSAIGIARVPEYFAAFDRLRDVADVILFDQRGAGQSGRLACPPGAPVPGTLFLTEQTMREALAPAFRTCVEHWRAEGVDFGQYHTNAIADDVDAIRAALGVERIALVGFSYGTHLGLAYVRRYEARVDRAVLIAVEGPDHTVKLPSWMDVHVANVARVAGRPDLPERLRAVLDRFEREPATFELRHPRTGDVARVQVGRAGLQYLIRRDIGDTNDLPRLPALIDALYRGEPSALQPIVARRYGGFSAGVALMGAAVDCASGASAERLAVVRKEGPSSLLGVDPLDEAACEALGVADLGDAFRSRLSSGVPTLFVSGTLDAHTPPFQAEEVRWGFPFSTHLIVDRAGHESLLTNAGVQGAMADFLAGRDVSGRRIEHRLEFAAAARRQALESRIPAHVPPAVHPSVLAPDEHFDRLAALDDALAAAVGLEEVRGVQDGRGAVGLDLGARELEAHEAAAAADEVGRCVQDRVP